MRLHSLHQSGFIHNDLKSGNIVVGRHNDQNTIYLIDFGLATRLNDDKGKHIVKKKLY